MTKMNVTSALLASLLSLGLLTACGDDKEDEDGITAANVTLAQCEELFGDEHGHDDDHIDGAGGEAGDDHAAGGEGGEGAEHEDEDEHEDEHDHDHDHEEEDFDGDGDHDDDDEAIEERCEELLEESHDH